MRMSINLRCGTRFLFGKTRQLSWRREVIGRPKIAVVPKWRWGAAAANKRNFSQTTPLAVTTYESFEEDTP